MRPRHRPLALAVCLCTVALQLPAADTFRFTKIIAAGDPFPAAAGTLNLHQNPRVRSPGYAGIDDVGGVVFAVGSDGLSFTTLAKWDPENGASALLTSSGPALPGVAVPCTRQDNNCGPPRTRRFGNFIVRGDGPALFDYTASETRAGTNFFGADHRYLVSLNPDGGNATEITTLDEPPATQARSISNFTGYAPFRDAVITQNGDQTYTLRSGGTVTELTRDGAPVPGLPAGHTLHPNAFAIFNNTYAECAFVCSIRDGGNIDGTGVFAIDESATLHTVAATGELHPTLPQLAVAGRWQTFNTSLSINNDGTVVFAAGVTDPGGGTQPKHSVWRTTVDDPAHPQLLLLAGETINVPGIGDITPTFFSTPAVSATGTVYVQVTYRAEVTVQNVTFDTPHIALCKIDPASGQTSLVLGPGEVSWRTGAAVPGIPGSRLATFSTATVNTADRLAFTATYYDAEDATQTALFAQDRNGDLAVLTHTGQSLSIIDPGNPPLPARVNLIGFAHNPGLNTTASNGQDGRGTSFGDSGRLLLNLRLTLPASPDPSTPVPHLVAVDFTTDGIPVGNEYHWTGAAGTTDWHTVTGAGTTNWADKDGTPWPTVPGSRGDENIFLTEATVVARNPVAVGTVNAFRGSLTIAENTEFNIAQISDIENLVLKPGATLTTTGDIELHGAGSRWEGGTLRSRGENGLFSVASVREFFLRGAGADRVLDGKLHVRGKLHLDDSAATLHLADGAELKVIQQGEVKQDGDIHFDGAGTISNANAWELEGGADITAPASPPVAPTFVIERTGFLFAGEVDRVQNTIGPGVSTHLEGTLTTIADLTVAGPLVIDPDPARIDREIDIGDADLGFGGSLTVRDQLTLVGDTATGGPGPLVFDLPSDKIIVTPPPLPRTTLSVFSDLEWRSGDTQNIDIQVRGDLAKITGDNVSHPGSLDVGDTAERARQSDASQLSIEGKNTTIGSGNTGHLKVGRHSTLEVDDTTTVNTASFLVEPYANLIQPGDLTVTCDVENRGNHFVGGAFTVAAPGTTYTAAHTDDRFDDFPSTVLVAHSPVGTVVAPVFKTSRTRIEAPADQSIEFWCGQFLHFRTFPDQTEPFLADGWLNFRTPRLDIAPTGIVNFSDSNGNPHRLTKVTADLTLRGDGEHDATLNNLPVTTTDLEVGGYLTLENYRLIAGDGANLSVAGSLRLHQSTVTVDPGGALRVLQNGTLRGNGTLDAAWTTLGGRVSPNDGSDSVGTLTFNGTLTFLPSGEYTATVRPGRNDHLVVNGRVELGGALSPYTGSTSYQELKAIDATLVTATTRDGRFANVPRGRTPISLRPDVGYSATRALLTFIDADAPPTYGLRIDFEFLESELADPGISGPGADPDGDGLDNFAEHVLGTPMKDPTPNPLRLAPYAMMPGSFILGFPVVDDLTDARVTVESKPPAGGTWTADDLEEMDPVPLGGDLSFRRYLVTPAPGLPANLYRLRFDQQ